MKLVTEMPTTGRFARCHMYDGQLWSMLMEWRDGQLFEFQPNECDWVHFGGSLLGYDNHGQCTDVHYLVG